MPEVKMRWHKVGFDMPCEVYVFAWNKEDAIKRAKTKESILSAELSNPKNFTVAETEV